MTKKNQFWKGILIGAVAGGAISLLDKSTREAMKENVKVVSGKVNHLLQNRGEIVGQMRETATKLRNTIQQVSEDVSFIVEKVDDLRELTPKVTEAIIETKETLLKGDEMDQVDDKNVQ